MNSAPVPNSEIESLSCSATVATVATVALLSIQVSGVKANLNLCFQVVGDFSICNV